MCLRDMASFIINSKWYKDRKENVCEESERIILAAAKLIRTQIHEHSYSKDCYPTTSDITDRAVLKDWIPQGLYLMMKSLVPDELKQITISHTIVQASRPRSVISPVLFGVGVEMDHLYRSKFLVNTLFHWGFSISYDEITRYKQSVIRASDDSFDIRPYPSHFTQWVGDNVDHNTKTLDGLNTFHGMGLIATSTPLSASTDAIEDRPVMRLKRTSVKDVIKYCGIEIKFYSPPAKPALCNVIFRAAKHLQYVSVLPSSMNLEYVWYTSWYFPKDQSMHANWSGFMQTMSIGDHPAVTDVVLLPIIDLNPSDEHCIFSTLSYVKEQAASSSSSSSSV